MKTCKVCQQPFPATPDFFSRRPGCLDGLLPTCKQCHNQATRSKRKRPHARTLQEYFFRHVTPGDPEACWEWQGARLPKGYGHFRFQNKDYTSHRVAWELHHGPIPDGLFVCHDCPGGDNPACVNWVNHLFLGTNYDNIFDAIAKGRHVARMQADTVRLMRHLRRRGHTLHELATQFDVSERTVWDICAYRRWRHIP